MDFKLLQFLTLASVLVVSCSTSNNDEKNNNLPDKEEETVIVVNPTDKEEEEEGTVIVVEPTDESYYEYDHTTEPIPEQTPQPTSNGPQTAYIPCPLCGGTTFCGGCGGTGQIYSFGEWKDCPACGGTRACSACQGSGVQETVISW